MAIAEPPTITIVDLPVEQPTDRPTPLQSMLDDMRALNPDDFDGVENCLVQQLVNRHSGVSYNYGATRSVQILATFYGGGVTENQFVRCLYSKSFRLGAGRAAHAHAVAIAEQLAEEFIHGHS